MTLNNQKVADIWAGASEAVDVAPGKAVLGVEAWSYPGTYRLEIDAKAGVVYRVAIAPRGESFGPSLILGPFGGLVHKDGKGQQRCLHDAARAHGGGQGSGQALRGRKGEEGLIARPITSRALAERR